MPSGNNEIRRKEKPITTIECPLWAFIIIASACLVAGATIGTIMTAMRVVC